MNRKSSVKVLAAFVLICVIALNFKPVNSATLTHIVINEVELNPPGRDDNREWIELYNPTSSKVNIGGWILTTKYKRTYTIPSDTFIEADSYFIITLPGFFLANTNEQVILKDASKREIDKTPIMNDVEDSAKTWQRYPNGVDTDSNMDWQFKASTKSSSNGGETLTCSISHSTINIGESVTVSGSLDPKHVALIKIEVNPLGSGWIFLASVISSSDGGFSFNWTPDKVGSYQFRAIYGDVTSNTVSLTVNKLSSGIIMFLPRKVLEDSNMSVLGYVKPIRVGVPITLTYGLPNGTLLTENVSTLSNGYFNHTFIPDAPGIWNVTAKWNGDDVTYGATSQLFTFEVEKKEEGFAPALALMIAAALSGAIIVAGLGLKSKKPPEKPYTPLKLLKPLKPAPQPTLPPSVRPVSIIRMCPTCKQQAAYIPKYSAWYCPRCKKYIS
ncbi:lamin tail domain-containing protein [Candidatus Bathyarchaeota archaeon]|nr:lamin tail domain-containing protein [Candidatus Bathyarchaeota archaeon]